MISKADQPVPDPVPQRTGRVMFGGLKGEIGYHDPAFAEPDPEIQLMFYGEDAAHFIVDATA